MRCGELLTERDVAERLRCSTSKVKRLRLSGQLGYIDGKPVLISTEALAAYLEARSRPATLEPRRKSLKSKPAQRTPEQEAAAQMVQEAKLWALEKRARRGYPLLRNANLGSDRRSSWSLDKMRRIDDTPGRRRPKSEPAKALRGSPKLRQAESGIWYVQWSEDRRSKRRSTGTRERAEAQRFFAGWLRDRSPGQPKMSSGAASATD